MYSMLKKSVVLVVCLASVSCAGILDKPWSFTAAGNEDQVELRTGLRDGKGEAGIEAIWCDGRNAGHEVIGSAIYGTWDAIDNVDLPFTLPFGTGSGTVKATGYLGARVGFLVNTRGKPDYDATAAGLVGVRFGGPKILIGLEWQAAVTKDVWSIMADSDKSLLLATVVYRTK